MKRIYYAYRRWRLAKPCRIKRGMGYNGATCWLVLLTCAAAACATDYQILARPDVGLAVGSAGDILYVERDLYEDAILYMPFTARDGDGTYYDYSRERNDGTQADTNARPVIVDGYAQFDGGNDIIAVDGQIPLSGAFTLAAWINVTIRQASYAVSQSDGNSNGRILFWSDSAGFLRFHLGSQTIATSTVETNTWQHMAMTREETNGVAIAYWNGVEIGTITNASALPDLDLEVGGTVRFPDRYFAGRVDDVVIIASILDSNEIYRIYQRGRSE
jgi:hypothetical protein